MTKPKKKTAYCVRNILKDMKANNIPEGKSGLWKVRKIALKKKRFTTHHDELRWLTRGIYTYLHRVTLSTLNKNHGEIVMEDTPYELKTHLNFIMKAKGKVLVSGLGLGCVCRGLLANRNVEHVTCVENSQDVLNLVEPYMPTGRLTIIKSDAREWVKSNSDRFDCAYHDLWTNRDDGEPHLAVLHIQLIKDCTVKLQGAWGMPRSIKNALKRKIVWA